MAGLETLIWRKAQAQGAQVVTQSGPPKSLEGEKSRKDPSLSDRDGVKPPPPLTLDILNIV